MDIEKKKEKIIPGFLCRSKELEAVEGKSAVEGHCDSGELSVSDRVLWTPSPSEWKFKCSLNGVDLPSVLDTGAGLPYLVIPHGSKVPFPYTRCNLVVHVANGREVKIDRKVEGLMRVGALQRNVTLFVLPCATGTPFVLFGRVLIQSFKVRVDPDGSMYTVSDSGVLDQLNLLAEKQVEVCDDLGIEAVDPVECEKVDQYAVPFNPEDHLPLKDEDRVVFPISGAGEARVMKILADLIDKGWIPLGGSPGLFVRLRALSDGEMHDVGAAQKYTFELRLPPVTTAPVKFRDYSEYMMAKLSDGQREEYGALVAEYVSQGWWIPAEATACAQATQIPPATVFPHCPKKRMRLVCDFREANKSFPSTVTMCKLWHSIGGIRLLCHRHITIADAKSAFYRVRLEGDTRVWLSTAVGQFLCSRMCFGLSFGPSGLKGSLGSLFESWQRTSQNSISTSMFVDDLHVGTDSPVLEELGVLFEVFLRCGFEVPKKKFQLVSEGTEGTLLGSHISILVSNDMGTGPATQTVVRCGRQERLEGCREILSRPATKRELFGAAGMLGYDGVRMHAEARLAADVLRAVVGSAFSSVPWKSLVNWDLCSKEDQILFAKVKKWCLELCDQGGDCAHSTWMTAPSREERSLSIRLESDASCFGGGCRVFVSDGSAFVQLFEDAYAWRKAEFNYHVNRLELIAAFRGIRALTTFLEEVQSMQTVRFRISEIRVLIDNMSVVTWINGCFNANKGKHYELRLMARVLEGLQQEVEVLRTLADVVKVDHVKGEQNTSDGLSRLLYRDGIGAMLRQRYEKKLKRGTTELTAIDEVLWTKDFTPVSDSVIESIACDSRSLDQVVWKFSVFKLLLRAWKKLVADGRTSTLAEITPSGSESERMEFMVCCQLDLSPRDRLRFSHSAHGQGQLVYYSKPIHTGEVQPQVVIPDHLSQLQRVIATERHRDCDHRGADYVRATLAVHLLRGRSRVQRLVHGCVVCQARHGRQAWALPREPYARETTGPPYSRVAIDHLHFGAGAFALSVYCLDTCHVSLLSVDSVETTSAVAALVRLYHRYGLCIKLVYSDNASCFTSPKFKELLRASGILVDIEHTDPYSSYQNPVERVHRDILDILRVRLRGQLADIGRIDQDLFDSVCFVLNQRPLGWTDDKGCATPQQLAFGFGPESSLVMRNEQLSKFRVWFYQTVFQQLKLDSHRRRHVLERFFIGERVLCYVPGPKLALNWFCARIRDIKGNRFLIEKQGQVKWYGSMNVLKLHLPLDAPQFPNRVGCMVMTRVGSYSDVGDRQYQGVVVQDLNEFGAVVAWTEGNYPDEVIDWEACEIVSSMTLGIQGGDEGAQDGLRVSEE